MKFTFLKIFINIKKTIIKNPFRSLFIFSYLYGLILLGSYFINNKFFPELSTENFIQLSFLYFITATLFIIYICIFIFAPGQIIIEIKNSKTVLEKIFFTINLFIIILTFLFLNNFYFFNSNTSSFILICIIAAIIIFLNLLYLKIYNFEKKILLFIIVFISLLTFFTFNDFSKIITKTFSLGNYNATIILKNQKLCKLFSLKTKCKINSKIKWNYGKFYYIIYNNKTYKIKREDIETEIIK